MLIVKKFGGTSVGSIERMNKVAERIQRDIARGEKPVLVASAMAGETNRLVDLAKQIDPLHRGPAYDMLLAAGEQISISLLSMALAKQGIKSKPMLAYQLGVLTDNLYSKARIKNIKTESLLEMVGQGVVPVIAGFQGVDEDQNITTLGRGGSDTTAVAVAAALQCQTCEIFTDVAKVFSADPRLVQRARPLDQLSFEEMMEMASLGSKVLHIRSVEIGAKYNVRIHLRSSFEDREGTWIVPEGEALENPLVSAVTHDAATVIVKMGSIPKDIDILAKIFEGLAKRGITIDIITQSQVTDHQTLAFSVTEEDLPLTRSLLAEMNYAPSQVEIIEGLAKISVVGVGMRNHPGVASRFFRILAENAVPVLLVTTSEIKISAVIDKKHLSVAAQKLHSEFELDV